MLYCSKTNQTKNLGPFIAGLMIFALGLTLAGSLSEGKRAFGTLEQAVAGPAIASR